MKILWTLTTELPVYCAGLFATKEEAEKFKEENQLENMMATPVMCDDSSP